MFKQIIKINKYKAYCLIGSKIMFIVGVLLLIFSKFDLLFLYGSIITLVLCLILAIVSFIIGIRLNSIINTYVKDNNISNKKYNKVEWNFSTCAPWKLLKGINSEKEFQDKLKQFYNSFE